MNKDNVPSGHSLWHSQWWHSLFSGFPHEQQQPAFSSFPDVLGGVVDDFAHKHRHDVSLAEGLSDSFVGAIIVRRHLQHESLSTNLPSSFVGDFSVFFDCLRGNPWEKVIKMHNNKHHRWTFSLPIFPGKISPSVEHQFHRSKTHLAATLHRNLIQRWS